MTYPEKPTIETAFGPAEYTVTADGLLYLAWPQGVTVHRVPYSSSANAYQTRSRYDQRVTTHAYLSREQGIKPPSLAALMEITKEAERLAPLLVTPLLVARARAENAHTAVKRAEREHVQAEEASRCAHADYAAACEALRVLEEEAA